MRTHNMKNSTTSLKVLTIVMLAIPFSSFANSWSCRHDNNVREIHIKLETDAPAPCSVIYKKLTEGVEDQVLWTAQNDGNYCEEKAKAFVEKQIGWGWTCVETISDEINTEESTTTTTEKNAPAETSSAGTTTGEASPAIETSTATDTKAKPAE